MDLDLGRRTGILEGRIGAWGDFSGSSRLPLGDRRRIRRSVPSPFISDKKIWYQYQVRTPKTSQYYPQPSPASPARFRCSYPEPKSTPNPIIAGTGPHLLRPPHDLPEDMVNTLQKAEVLVLFVQFEVASSTPYRRQRSSSSSRSRRQHPTEGRGPRPLRPIRGRQWHRPPSVSSR